MEYQFIKELSGKDRALASTEVNALGKLWNEKKNELQGSGLDKKFLEKMKREWAIETGIIERLYTWDRGVTESLIEHGLNANLIPRNKGGDIDEVEDVIGIIKDQQGIIDGLFPFVKDGKQLSEHFIREIHQKMTEHQKFTNAKDSSGRIAKIDFLKGAYKESPNNPQRSDGTMHKYCPPIHVKSEMQKLINLYSQYEEERVDTVVLSAWLHHRFTQIHPFQDGNGRIARTLASLVFIKAGFFPLLVKDSDRTEYLDALEKGDRGSLRELVKLFTRLQRNAVLSALSLQQTLEQHEDKIIKNAISLIERRDKDKLEDIEKPLHRIAGLLRKAIEGKLQETSVKINGELKTTSHFRKGSYKASLKSVKNDEDNSHYYWNQIVAMAKKHDYYANLKAYKSWIRLVVHTGSTFEIVFSIHGHGYSNSGVMVVSGFSFEKAASDETGNTWEETIEVKTCHKDVFQFNYLEDETDTLTRFEEWLDESTVIALVEWNKTLR